MCDAVVASILFLVASFLGASAAAKNEPAFIPMKVVDEIHSYGPVGEHLPSGSLGSANGIYGENNRKRPGNFSGPPQFRLLVGRCFEYYDEKYVWTFCPFDNMTQTAVPGSLHPYDGVIGVWREWIIENGTFVGMKFDDGDFCGDGHARNVEVRISCGNAGRVARVDESEHCKYAVNFTTRLACGDGAMDVRNALDPPSLRKLSDLEADFLSGIFTSLGFSRRLREVYASAGLILSSSPAASSSMRFRKDDNDDDIVRSRSAVAHEQVPDFSSLEECKFAFGALQKMSGLAASAPSRAKDAEKEKDGGDSNVNIPVP